MRIRPTYNIVYSVIKMTKQHVTKIALLRPIGHVISAGQSAQCTCSSNFHSAIYDRKEHNVRFC